MKLYLKFRVKPLEGLHHWCQLQQVDVGISPFEPEKRFFVTAVTQIANQRGKFYARGLLRIDETRTRVRNKT